MPQAPVLECIQRKRVSLPLSDAVGTKEHVEQKTDETEHQSRNESLPEARYMEPPDQIGSQVKQEGVNKERKQPKGQHRYRQGEKYENGTKKSIQEPQNDGGHEDGHPVVQGNAGNDVSNNEKRRAVDDPLYEELFHVLTG